MELESQVAKIQLGPEDASASGFTYVLAERLGQGDSESFMVAEILEASGDLRASSEQIVLSIRGAVRRAFKKSQDPENFESAVAQANEELGKLASLGQTHWIEKLNCVISVKIQNNLHIATTGKVAAYLMRDNELTDVSCSAPKPHPLKTFENFASGKLKLGDVLVFSTSQLFNHLSIDKLKRLLSQDNFLRASGQVVELLKESAAGGVNFGSIFAQQLKKGTILEEAEIDLEEYVESAKPSSPGLLANTKRFVMSMVAPGKKISPQMRPSLSASRTERVKSGFMAIGGKTKRLLSALVKGASYGKKNLSPSQIRQFSPEKKFFFFSAAVLAFAVILLTSTAVYKKGQRQKEERILASLAQAQKYLSDADAALLYKDEPSAKEFYVKSLETLGSLKNLSKDQTAKADELKTQANEIKTRLERTVEVSTENLGTLAQGDTLIKLPEYLAVQSGPIVSFEKSTGTVRDDAIKISGTVALSQYISKNKAAVYDGVNLKLWDFASGTTGPGLESSVPAKENAAGMAYYPTNQRVYMVDKAKNQVVNFAVLNDQLGRALVSANLKNNDGKNARDLAIDGSLYILTAEAIKKYHSGSPDEFSPAFLTPLNDPKKISTKTDFSNIYILDAGNRRIVVLSKKGSVIMTLTSPDFTDLKDFEVDEKNKTIFILNGSSLLKVTMP